MEKYFISNNYLEGRKVLSTIEDELKRCESFSISVAFITNSGLTPLLQTLSELESKGIKGRILTTNYLTFSEPRALDKLNEFKNIELRVFNCDRNGEGFHTKGYIFKRKDENHILVGSSNLTLRALTVNKEWNTNIIVKSDDDYNSSIISEFEELWESDNTKPYNEVRYNYINEYNKFNTYLNKLNFDSEDSDIKLKPNFMQEAVINNLDESIKRGDKRGLLISATGTGKTYASAFAIAKQKPKRLLFLVHREQIAKQALKSYKRVFNTDKKYGLLSGNTKDYDADYLFSTMQMMAKDEILNRYAENYFDIIVIDEVHKAGSDSYQKIMNYFKPKYYFGMSASPDRTDGFDIYTLFDHNILYEIRLQEAMKEDLLCPFHYFGITDLELNGEVFNDKSSDTNFNNLVCDARVNHIIDKINFYGFSGDRAKGLIFCSSKNEARELSNKFNLKGYKTVALTGEDNQVYREECINKLVSDNEDYLDFIFTVDIFNEGVDIPEINLVVMLRPTESSIIFIQQLGRGLRKKENKEFVVIIDFIGNYKNNFLIPMALNGDRSYNKDTVRRYLQEGSKIMPGSSTIHFDEISKERIYQAIDKANFNQVSIIKEAYDSLKNKLGKIPSLIEFDKYGSIDPLRIFDNKNFGSYHKFLYKHDDDYNIQFSSEKIEMLTFISRKLASGKRPQELLVLKYLIEGKNNIFENLKLDLKTNYDIDLTNNMQNTIINVLTNNFITGTTNAMGTFKNCIFIEKIKEDYKISTNFKELLKDNDFLKQIKEIVNFGLYRNFKNYNNRYKNTDFNLYSKYTYEDVCRLLNWDKSIVAQNISGYKYDDLTNTLPIFINYKKDDNISDSIKYEDRFIANDKLIAISKSKRRINSADVQKFLNSKKLGIELDLFIRKDKNDNNDSKEFYYLGKVDPTGNCNEIVMEGSNTTAVEIEYNLETPVKNDLYDYIIS